MAGGKKTGRVEREGSGWAQSEIVALKLLRQFFCGAYYSFVASLFHSPVPAVIPAQMASER
jgi:hypothetical protein